MKITLAVLLLCLCSLSFAQTPRPLPSSNTGIIYGPSHAFAISAPKGFVLDNHSGVNSGLHAVFYPIGSTWEKSNVVMYVNGFKKDPDEHSIEDFIKKDVLDVQTKSPQIKVANGQSIFTADHKEVVIREFTGDQWGNYECIGYLEEKSSIVLFALSSKSSDIYKKSLLSLRELINSYQFISEQVNFQS